MDAMFKALADESRRKLLDELHRNTGQTLTQLCGLLDMTRQTVSKHLALLESANLVVTVWRGREKLHYFSPVSLHEIYGRWIDKYGVEGNPFGEVIYAYTRAQAVADGFQVEVTKTAQEAGIKFPVFITRTAFDDYVDRATERDRPRRSREALGCRLDAPFCHSEGAVRSGSLAVCALCPQRQPRPAPKQTHCHVWRPRH